MSTGSGDRQAVPSDLTLTSFPFELAEDGAEGGANGSGRFSGFFGRFFSEPQAPPEPKLPTTSVVPAQEEPVPTPQASPSDNDSQAPRKLSSRLGNLLKSHRENDLVDYNGSVFRRYWMPDAAVQECYECHERFTTFRRRHHCRFCGQIFCGKCCSRQLAGAELGYAGILRLCNYCFNRVGSYCETLDRSAHNQTPVQSSPSTSRRAGTPVVAPPAAQNPEPSLHEEDSVPDLLAQASKHDLEVEQGALPEHDSLLSTYEPSADENEPEWVRNLHNRNIAEGNVFAPTSSPAAAQHADSSPASRVPETPRFEVRSSWTAFKRDDSQPPTLVQLFEGKTDALLDYLFEIEQVPREVWKPLLVPLAQQVVDLVQVDTNARPRLINVLDYVHIKKLCVNVPPSAQLQKVNGVVFSKAFHHRAMARYGENASVLLLAGNVTYERVVEKMSSLEPILQQEAEFLKNQVERLAARQVNLLFVEHSVSSVALELFLNAQIGVCTQMKAAVLERLARCTGADIISSLDAQFLQPRVGFCPRYYERAVRLADGSDKQLMVLDECDGSLGVSIVIRAPSMRELAAVKRILKLLLQVYYSNKCELAFLQLFNTAKPLLTSTCEVCEENQKDDNGRADESDFAAALKESQLTNSPLIRVVPPYLERVEGRDCFLLQYFKRPPYHFYRPAELKELARAELELEERVRTLEADIKESKTALGKRHVNSVLSNPHHTGTDIPLAGFRVRSVFLARRCAEVRAEMDEKCHEQKEKFRKQAAQQLAERPNGRNFDVLNTYKHQRRAFLYCAEGTARRFQNSFSFCSGPSVLVWRFYAGGEDMTLGTFLRRFCFNPDYKCKECEKGMAEHFRKIIHHNACIEITTQVMSAKTGCSLAELWPADEAADFDKDSLFAWKFCKKCATRSAAKLAYDLPLNMSFSKFVDYLCNAVHWVSGLKGVDCQHCSFHEHAHLFGMNNMLTLFSVSPVRPLHVLFAPVKCLLEARSVPVRSLLTELAELKRLSAELFKELAKVCTDSVSAQLLHNLQLHSQALARDFDPDGHLSQATSVSSDDPVFVKSDDSLTRTRHFLHTVVDEWNGHRNQPGQPAALELEPPAKLKNLCAKFGLSLEPPAQAEEEQPLSELAADAFLRPADEQTEQQAGQSLCETSVNLPPLFSKNSHFELPVHRCSIPIVVVDNVDTKGQSSPDIGSVIAFALASKDYAEKRSLLLAKGESGRARSSSNSNSSFSSLWTPMTNSAAAAYSPAGLQPSALPSAPPAPPQGDPFEDPHSASIEVDFADSSAHYYVKVYFAENFRALREKLIPAGEEQFIRSVSRSEPWAPQGGKSGASFFRTKDERFVFKQMSRLEMESFKTCGPKYFEYINKALSENRLTALCKIYGVFRVGYTSKAFPSQLKMDLLVMEYLFYGKKTKQMWDLKGSLRNRYASTKHDAPVLLDENLVQDLWGNQLYVHHHSKVALKQAMANDSSFLSSQEIMDYSLLAGVCPDTNEVVVGIVDYMRTYTLDKRVESLVKTAIPNTHLPTVINPDNYCKRFCDAIDCYFAMAPDQWTCLDANVT